MKESLLRETIRKEIRKSLKEQDVSSRAETGISRLEKQPGIKMLKSALSAGSPKQQAAGLLKVINLVSGGARAVKSQLVQMLQQGGLGADEPVAEVNKFQMGKKRTSGLQQKDLGGAADIKRASGMFADIAKLDDKKKAKALAYLIKQAGVDKETFVKYFQRIKAGLGQLR